MESRLKASKIVQFGDGGAMGKCMTKMNNYEQLNELEILSNSQLLHHMLFGFEAQQQAGEREGNLLFLHKHIEIVLQLIFMQNLPN